MLSSLIKKTTFFGFPILRNQESVTPPLPYEILQQGETVNNRAFYADSGLRKAKTTGHSYLSNVPLLFQVFA
jgi:hypothetical protein